MLPPKQSPQEVAPNENSNNSYDQPEGEVTVIHDIKCNDGIMRLEIVASEIKGSGPSQHVTYHVKGQDSLGEIDVFRRYREFLQFRDLIFERYPGLVVPPVPPK